MIHSPSHPGWLIEEELRERRIPIARAAKDIGTSRQTISRIIHGVQPITADMAARLGHYFGGGAEAFIRMQAQYDLWQAQKNLENDLKKMPVAAA